MTFFTVEDVARQLHTTEDTVRRKAAEGSIPARKVGRRWLFHPDLLDKYMRNEWRSTNESKAEVGGSDSLYAARLFDEAPRQQIESAPKNSRRRYGSGSGGRRS